MIAIADFLSPYDVIAKVAAKDKDALLRDLAHRAEPATQLPGDLIARAILKREALGSTGVGHGIALPHARIPGLGKTYGLFVRLKKAIDFEAVDGKPVDLVFLLLLPADREEECRFALAAVARKLRDPAVVGAIRKAPDQTAIHAALTQDGPR
jgi:PTS system nitrogen regulatory IIA component